MQEKEEPYLYIYLEAFLNLVKYGNKDHIKIENLIKYKKEYLKKIINYEKIISSNKLKFKKIDDIESIDFFMCEYGNLFHLDNDKIYLNDDIEYDDIEDALLEITEEDTIFNASSDSLDLLKIIDATYISNLYKELLKNELKIEKAYLDYLSNPTIINRLALEDLTTEKTILLKVLSHTSDYRIEAIRNTAQENESVIEDDYGYNEYPYNEEIWSSVEHTEDLDIDEVLYSLNHYAIYSELPIYHKKLADELETLYLSKIKDDYGIFDEVSQGKKDNDFLDYIFYLKYISNIDDYLLKTKDDDLLESKNRLIYVLDKYNMKLFIDDNLKKEIEYANNITIDEDTLYLTKDEIIFLIGELFIDASYMHTSRKLLLIKTYYDLTKDEDIKTFFDDFKECKNYNAYKEVVFGRNKTKKL